MPRGPVLNDNSRSFTTRDSLGIEGVATTIQGEVCPIVNTVTPRAFYWPFMIWIYYDFYKYSGIEEKPNAKNPIIEIDHEINMSYFIWTRITIRKNGNKEIDKPQYI